MRLSKVFDLIVHRYIICVTCKFRGSGLPTHRRMLEKQKKCPKGKVSLHLNRKLFRRLPLDFHGKITLIDSPSTSVLVRYTQYPIMYIRTDLSNDPFITWIWIWSDEIYFWKSHLTNLIQIHLLNRLKTFLKKWK